MTTTAIEKRGATPMEPITALSILQEAVNKGADVATLKELVALQQSMVRFEQEQADRQAKIDFDIALNECQREIGRIAPDEQRKDSTHAWWATYPHLDATVRPVYTSKGFSVSFSERESAIEGKIRMLAVLARGGVSREYETYITPSTVGPQGKAVMTPTDADAAAGSRAMRYLLLKIFNIAIGIDKQDGRGGMGEEFLQEGLDLITQAETLPDCKDAYGRVYAKARDIGDDQATLKIIAAFEAAKKAFAKGEK